MDIGRKFLLTGLCLSVFLTGCQKTATNGADNYKNVTVKQVAEENCSVGLSYLGVVKPKETKNYSFLAGGKIKEIYVEKGQEIKVGDSLAELDTTQIKFSAAMSANNAEIARSTLQKTKETYDTNIKNAEISIETLEASIEAAKLGLDNLKSNVEDYKVLYEFGAISASDLDAMKVGYKAKEAEYKALLGNYETAKESLTNLRKSKQRDVNIAEASVVISDTTSAQAEQNIADAVLRAESDGYVMEIPFKKGEIAGAGYPVIISKSKDLVVSIGVSTDKYNQISMNSEVLINGAIKGTVDSIASYPDQESRLYAVDIKFEAESIAVGETVDVIVYTGEEKGYFVPIDSVFYIDGINYVYVVDEKNKVNKRQVVLGKISGSMVRVTNLDENAFVVTDGVKTLKDNDIVSIVQQEEGNKE